MEEKDIQRFIKELEKQKSPSDLEEARTWFNEIKDIWFDLDSEIPKAISLRNDTINEAIAVFKNLFAESNYYFKVTTKD